MRNCTPCAPSGDAKNRCCGGSRTSMSWSPRSSHDPLFRRAASWSMPHSLGTGIWSSRRTCFRSWRTYCTVTNFGRSLRWKKLINSSRHCTIWPFSLRMRSSPGQQSRVTPRLADRRLPLRDMRWREHEPAHFHAHYGEFEASIGIDPLTLLHSTLPPRQLGLVMEWAAQHQSELNGNWERSHQRKPLEAIPPLP